MSNLKSRIVKLEAAGAKATYPGIIIYFESTVRKEVEGVFEIVDADYYLNEDRTEPVTIEEINELDKQMIVFLPFRDKEDN